MHGTTAARQPAAGWYSTGRHEVVGEWDGSAWTARGRIDAVAGAVPHWKVRAFAFFGHLWFWLLVAGIVLVAASGFLGNGATTQWWKLLTAVGMIAILSSVVLFFDRILRFRELPNLGVVVLAGLVAGAVANGIAYVIEPILEPALGVPFAVDLWLSGPVEETAKLAVPFLLLLFARRAFGDPRAGVLMVLISGAGFGVWEGFTYIAGATGERGTELAGLIRGIGEIPHPLWTAIAASLIWLAAHRARRAVTLAGFVGWLIAMVFHSIHDGIGAFSQSGTQNTISQTSLTSLTEVFVLSAVQNLFTIVTIVIAFFVLRHVSREVVSPTGATGNPPRWRPHLKQWGVPRHERTPIEKSAVPAA